MKKEDFILYKLKQNWIVYILAFIGGYIDAIGYINLDGLFTSSITGNIVVACTSVAEAQVGLVARALSTILFFIGGFIAVLISSILRCTYKFNKFRVAIILFSLEILSFSVALITSIILDYSGYSFDSIRSPQVIILGMMLGFSMGIHNGVAQEVIVDCPATTVITMTIVKLSVNIANIFQKYLAIKTTNNIQSTEYENLIISYNKTSKKVRTLYKPFLFFILGAIIGSAINKAIYFWCLFIPMFLLLIIIIDIYIAERYAIIENTRELESKAVSNGAHNEINQNESIRSEVL